MKRSCVLFTPLLALLLLPGSRAAAQPEASAPKPSQDVRYEIRFMDLHAAEVLAWDQCPQKERCKVAALSLGGAPTLKGYLDVRAEPAVQEKIAHLLAREDGNPRTQSFQLLLLAASTRSRSTGPEVPANAQKALTDLKGFLPFKSYELLDTGWLRSTQDKTTEARLVGRQDAGFEVGLQFRAMASGDLFIDFFRLKAEPFTPISPGGAKDARNTQPGRVLIDTTFGIKPGETVVVGTSKVNGADEALVVLLTAVPAS